MGKTSKELVGNATIQGILSTYMCHATIIHHNDEQKAKLLLKRLKKNLKKTAKKKKKNKKK
jgi:hypothetical protein